MNSIQQIEAAISQLTICGNGYPVGRVEGTVNGHAVRVSCRGQYHNASQRMMGVQAWYIDGKRVARAKVDAMVQA